MPFVKPKSNFDHDPINNFECSGETLGQRTSGHFTIRKAWHTLLNSAGGLTMSLWLSIGPMAILSSFPWDDSTFGDKLIMILICSPHSLFSIWLFIVSVMIWTNPYKLKFDSTGSLILRSLVRDQRFTIKDIRTVVLAQKEDGEDSGDALSIRTKFSGGKLMLPPFAEREEFMKALKSFHPAIVVETV
jgi:hypothetical protein